MATGLRQARPGAACGHSLPCGLQRGAWQRPRIATSQLSQPPRLHSACAARNGSLCVPTRQRLAHREEGRPARRSVVARSGGDESSLFSLGLDFLTFLSATVLVVPLFKSLRLSPVLGFLFAGVVLKQLG
jgi:hypothetical protein